MSEPVMIVAYNPDWPRQFGAEANAIRQALGDGSVLIEHVGSTAVPGPSAKPILDLMVGVTDLAKAPACVEPLARLGYAYVPEYEAQMPERHYFRKGTPRTHHLHMVEQGSDFWEKQLRFRDYLRHHPQAVRDYDGLKRELAQRYRHDRQAYTEAKTAFITSVLHAARGTP